MGLRVRGGDRGGGYYHTSTQGPPYVSEDTRVRTSGHCRRCCCSTRDPRALPRPFTLSYRWVNTQTHRGVLTAGKCQRHICPKKLAHLTPPRWRRHTQSAALGGEEREKKKTEISDTVSPLIALLGRESCCRNSSEFLCPMSSCILQDLESECCEAQN